jgi:hypothetical protein
MISGRGELCVVRIKVLSGASCVDVYVRTQEKPWGIKGTTYLPYAGNHLSQWCSKAIVKQKEHVGSSDSDKIILENDSLAPFPATRRNCTVLWYLGSKSRVLEL